jgi:hypothetical protein
VAADWLSAAPAVVTDAAVVGFAVWTVVYHAAFFVGLRPSGSLFVWAAVSVAFGVVALRRRPRRRDHPLPTADTAAAPPVDRRWLVAAVVSGVVAALAASFRPPWLSWWTVVLFGFLAASATLLAFWPGGLTAGDGTARPMYPYQAAYALLASLVVALSSLVMARNTPDDVFYVGKSVWIAEHDFIPLRDFLFTENVAPAFSSQPPISSIEAFDGALAHVLNVHAASATWYVMLPIMAVIATLAVWRLAHRWAPRRPVLVFTVAMSFLYLVAGDDAALGTFHLPRLHEGKGMFVSAAVPLLWLYLTDWFETRSRRSLGLLVALSITATGLTTTSAFIMPILVAAGGLVMSVTGRWRAALVADLAVVAYPAAALVVTRFALGPVTSPVATAQFFDAAGTYGRTFVGGVVGVVGGIALWCGALTVRRGTPALLVLGATIVMTVLFVPGVLEAISAASGLSAVLWRLPWIVPLPVLVGMLCAVSVPRWRTVVATSMTVAVVGACAVFGTPMWSEKSFVQVYDHPVWKLPQQRQRLAFWITGLDRPPGLVLAPSTIMRTIPIVTSRVRVAMARTGYLVEFDINSQFSRDRLMLADFADNRRQAPITELNSAMDRVGVTVVCVYKSNTPAIEAAPALGLKEFASIGGPGAMRCFKSSGGR